MQTTTTAHQITAKKMLSQRDLATYLGVSDWQIWKLRKQGALPDAVKVGKSLRWRFETVEKFFKEREKSSAQFDSELRARAEKGVKGRGQEIKAAKKHAQRMGRPKKKPSGKQSPAGQNG